MPRISHAAVWKGSCASPGVTIVKSYGAYGERFLRTNLAITQPKPGSAQIAEVMRPSSDLLS